MIVYVSFLAEEIHKNEISLVPDQYLKYFLTKNNFFK